eukprot:COSAG02_NODE_2223_length_9455_cov_5.513675_1_plen_725_part_00
MQLAAVRAASRQQPRGFLRARQRQQSVGHPLAPPPPCGYGRALRYGGAREQACACLHAAQQPGFGRYGDARAAFGGCGADAVGRDVLSLGGGGGGGGSGGWPVVPRRGLHATPAAWDDDSKEKESAKVPAVKELSSVSKLAVAVREEKKQAATVRKLPARIAAWGKNVALEVRDNPRAVAAFPKRVWKAVKGVANHTWTGCKLLAAETRIASRIIGRMLQGRSISRRERSLLQRVITDLLRLIPFSFFIIIPAMEIFLPAALWLFPNMMPSTFKSEGQRSDQKKRRLGALVDSAKFLADCLERDAKHLQERNKDKMDLSDFIARLRAGQPVPNELIFSIAKHFKDEFLLDNLPRPQLIAMCSFLHIDGPFGPDVHVRFLLRRRMRQIQNDDKEIFWEGIDSLSEEEVSEACGLRGIRTDKSVFEARRMLGEWLELSTRKDLPTSLLLFSRAAEVASYDRRSATQQAQQIELAVTTLPESVVDELIEEEVGDKISRERKLELLKEQEKLVMEELRMEDDELEEQKDEIKRKKKEEKKKNKKKQQAKEEEQDTALEGEEASAAASTVEDAETVGGAATATAAAEAAVPATEIPASVQAEATETAKATTPEETTQDKASADDLAAASGEQDLDEEDEEEAKISLDGRESLTLDQAEHVFEELEGPLCLRGSPLLRYAVLPARHPTPQRDRACVPPANCPSPLLCVQIGHPTQLCAKKMKSAAARQRT